jgi:hypothetical protein
MSFITSLHPVPDVSGIVESICTFCDASGQITDDDPWEVGADESLDLNHLVAVLREILKVLLCIPPEMTLMYSRQVGAILVSLDFTSRKTLRNRISTVDILPETVQTGRCDLV